MRKMEPRRSVFDSESKTALVMVTPAMLLIMALGIVPVVCVVIFSLGRIHPATLKYSFLGLTNYAEVLSNAEFWTSMGITIYFTFVSVALQLVLGMLVAMLLNQQFRGRWFVRTLALLPWAVPTIVNANLWKWILNTNYGILNKLLLSLNLIDENVLWLSNTSLTLHMVILVDTWRMMPLVFLMLLASLQMISGSMIEAARVDGAGPFKRFVYIYLPSVKQMLLVVLVLRSIQAFKVFDIIFTMTKGGPNNSTTTISFYTYYEIFDYLNYGKGAAIALVILALMLLLTLGYKRLLRAND